MGAPVWLSLTTALLFLAAGQNSAPPLAPQSPALTTLRAALAAVRDVKSMEDQTSARQARGCSHIRLPAGLCPACRMRPFTGRGWGVSFGGVNRFDMYYLDNARCVQQLYAYARMNPCDKYHRNAIWTFGKNRSSRLKVIYFLYSVCETCCDCIPIGAREHQYNARRANRKLHNVYRGNCAAHFVFDTCKVWPDANQITGPKGKPAGESVPKWCPEFERWIRSPVSSNWLRKSHVRGLTPNMVRAMRQITNFAHCRDRTLWLNCISMERAQNRI